MVIASAASRVSPLSKYTVHANVIVGYPRVISVGIRQCISVFFRNLQYYVAAKNLTVFCICHVKSEGNEQ